MANSTDLYSYKGESPTTLPNKIRPSEGVVRTDVSSFSDGEVADAGFTGPYTVPSYNKETQTLTWDSSNLKYVVADISDDDLWATIRKERNRLLSESDWAMAADLPGHLNLREWELYRQRLRDLPTLYQNAKDVVYPPSPEINENFDLELVVEMTLRQRIKKLEEFCDIILEKNPDLVS